MEELRKMTRILVLLLCCAAVLTIPFARSQANPSALMNPRVWKTMVDVGKFVAESVAQHEIGEVIDRLAGRNLQEELQQVKSMVEEEAARGADRQAELDLISSAVTSIGALLKPALSSQDVASVVTQTRRDLETLARMQREHSAQLEDHEERIDQLESQLAQVDLLIATLQAIPIGAGSGHAHAAVSTGGVIEIPDDVTYLWAMFVPSGSSVKRNATDPMSPEEFTQRLSGLLEEACNNGDRLIVTAQGDQPGEWHSQWLKYNGKRLPLERYDSCDGCVGGAFPLPCDD